MCRSAGLGGLGSQVLGPRASEFSVPAPFGPLLGVQLFRGLGFRVRCRMRRGHWCTFSSMFGRPLFFKVHNIGLSMSLESSNACPCAGCRKAQGHNVDTTLAPYVPAPASHWTLPDLDPQSQTPTLNPNQKSWPTRLGHCQDG